MVEETRNRLSSVQYSQANDEEVIRLATSEESDNVRNRVTPPSNQPLKSEENNMVCEEPMFESIHNFTMSINESIENMNGVLGFDASFDEITESPFSFISLPTTKYHSRNDANFDDYLDWIVNSASCHSF
mmetsp:Transcript_23835/g.21174  ORF Transcript_23835/g.21174 Transcript_23835/m.21174 type:complete len:130 (+) Transcript_23835:329-718(+)